MCTTGYEPATLNGHIVKHAGLDFFLSYSVRGLYLKCFTRDIAQTDRPGGEPREPRALL